MRSQRWIALSAVTLQADHQETLNLATRAERLFGNDADSLSERVALRRRIIEGRRVLVEKAPVAWRAWRTGSPGSVLHRTDR